MDLQAALRMKLDSGDAQQGSASACAAELIAVAIRRSRQYADILSSVLGVPEPFFPPPEIKRFSQISISIDSASATY